MSNSFYGGFLTLSRLITLGRGQKPVRDDSEVLGPILHSLRQTLTPYEVDKYKELGNECGRILGQVARSTRRGMTEYEVAGNISSACLSKSIDIVVLMVGSDERLDTRRHPLPTNKVIKVSVFILFFMILQKQILHL